MGKLILWDMMTLDGFFEGSKSWELDWHEKVWGEELEQLSIEQLTSAEMLVFGRATYQGMAGYWTTATGTIADFMNEIPKVVFSRTLDQADWSNTRLVKDNAAEEMQRLKRASDKELFIFGSAGLASTFTQHRLIDEYRLGMTPTVLGGGTPLFKPGLRVQMKLLGARPLKSGCVILRYEPDGTERSA